MIGWILFYTVEADDKNNSNKNNNYTITNRKQSTDNDIMHF